MSNDVSCRKCGSSQSGKFCDHCGTAMARQWASGGELRTALAQNDTAAWKAVRDVLAATPTKELEAAGVSLPMFSAIQLQRIAPDEIPAAALDLVAAKHAATRAQQTEFTKAFRTPMSAPRPAAQPTPFAPSRVLEKGAWLRKVSADAQRSKTSWRVNR